MDWANLPTLVIEKIILHAANIEYEDKRWQMANQWLMTVRTLSTVCKNWMAITMGSKLIADNKHNCIEFNDCVEEYYDEERDCYNYPAKRLVRCGYLGFAKKLNLVYCRCPDTDDFNLVSEYAEGNTVEEILVCCCTMWSIRACSAFLNFVSKSKARSIELRSIAIRVQSEAHQFWTLLMGLIQCCQYNIPFISFELEATMCDLEITSESDEDGTVVF